MEGCEHEFLVCRIARADFLTRRSQLRGSDLSESSRNAGMDAEREISVFVRKNLSSSIHSVPEKASLSRKFRSSNHNTPMHDLISERILSKLSLMRQFFVDVTQCGWMVSRQFSLWIAACCINCFLREVLQNISEQSLVR